MTSAGIFFWSALTFMVGAVLISFWSFYLIFAVAFLLIIIFLLSGILKNESFLITVAFCLIFIIIGAWYGNFYSAVQNYFTSIFNGNVFQPLFLKLKEFKDGFEVNIETVLNARQAAFMNGLILGERQKFSPQFRDDLNISGTAHLVALSGYNITIIIWALAGFLGLFLSRRWVFIITIFAILGFVIMTGAAASVVRAAIMAGLVLLAERSERLYNPQNALITAAFLMTLSDPGILVSDLGFQLSFAAVLGLIYIKPRLKKWFGSDEGFLGWKDNLLTTSAAQAAVLPFLLFYFGYFSPLSLIANILILEVVPFTMLMGFLIGIAAFFSYSLAWMIGWLASLFLNYEIFIIQIFASLSRMIFNL